MEIITNAENRKELVKALSGHFGQRSEYLGPPSFAYRIGSITVDRDAKVILEDDSMEDEVRRVLFQNDVAEEPQETQTEEPEAEIKIPIGSMTPQGIINLINMMHSKQYLINRAVGRECISIADSLVNALAKVPSKIRRRQQGSLRNRADAAVLPLQTGTLSSRDFRVPMT